MHTKQNNFGWLQYKRVDFIHTKHKQLWITSVQTCWLYTYKTQTTLDNFSTNVLTLCILNKTTLDNFSTNVLTIYIQNKTTLDNFSTNVLTLYIQNSNNFGWLWYKRVDFIHTKQKQLWMTSVQTCWLYTYKTHQLWITSVQTCWL